MSDEQVDLSQIDAPQLDQNDQSELAAGEDEITGGSVPDPLTDEEILGALDFLTGLYADWQQDDFYRLTPFERDRMPEAVRQVLPENSGVTQAIRTLDLGGKYGILVSFFYRRATHQIRALRKKKEGQGTDQEQGELQVIRT
jgi:hypothetical protein